MKITLYPVEAGGKTYIITGVPTVDYQNFELSENFDGFLGTFSTPCLPGEAEAVGLDDLCVDLIEIYNTGYCNISPSIIHFERFKECWEWVGKKFHCIRIEEE